MIHGKLKQTLVLLSVLTSVIAGSSVAFGKDIKKSAIQDLYEEFSALSEQALMQESQALPPADKPTAFFIEQEVSQSLNNYQASMSSNAKDNGQWMVSFDLNRFDMSTNEFSFDSAVTNSPNQLTTDSSWGLGASLVSPDQTSKFFVNYGNRKVPISISFDQDPIGFSNFEEKNFSMEFEQSINESWAVSISYLKSGNTLLGTTDTQHLSSLHNLNYLFDFNQTNKIETVNFAPFTNDFTSSNFLDDISAIEIKVSRKLTNNFSMSANAANKHGKSLSEIETNTLNELGPLERRFVSRELSLTGNYNISDRWVLGANIELQKEQFEGFLLQEDRQDFTQLNSTTLDIGLQYQTSWNQVGIVIRMDLMNLLGKSEAYSDSIKPNVDNLKPFSFETPKFIKVSGSINF